MSLLLNTLPRFAITLLPRSSCPLIPWLQSPSKVTVEPKKRESVTTSAFSPSICHAVIKSDAMILVFLTFSLRTVVQFVQFSRSVVSDSATPWIAARQASLSITSSRSLLKLMPTESVMPSSHLMLCSPLLFLSPASGSFPVSQLKSCLTLCDPMDCSMPASSALQCLLEFAQIHVH